jgi:PAS domain S-box-containing protein
MQDVERQRDAAESRFTALVELTGFRLWITDSRGRTTWVDPALCRVLGYGTDEILGLPLADFLVQRERAEDHIQAMARAQVEDEFELRCRNGNTVAVVLSSRPVATESGGAVTMVAEAGRNQAEDETAILKNEFFALVSHELRTPLTSIRGYLDLLMETQKERLDQKGRDSLDVINRNTDRLSSLLGDLILLTQVAAGTFVVQCDLINLAEVTAGSVDAARPAADAAGIDLRLSQDEHLACWGDPGRLGQVCDNLITNAIKFTPADGHIDVRHGEKGEIATIEVADDGPGIPTADHAHLFGRFYQGSDARAQQVQGLGLGLAISKAIVDAHAGRIAVASTPGAGTTFTVELPRRHPQPGSKEWLRTSAVRNSRRW